MKKILASVLTAAMMLSMGTAVFAAEGSDTVEPGIISEVVLKDQKVNDYSDEVEECISVVMTTSPETAYRVVMYDKDGKEMVAVEPLANPADDLYGSNKLNAKIIFSDGVSDNWEQTNYVSFTDGVKPAKITVEMADGTVVGTYIVAETDTLYTKWADLKGTVADYNGTQDNVAANFDKAYDIVNEKNNSEAPAENFIFNVSPISAYDGDEKDILSKEIGEGESAKTVKAYMEEICKKLNLKAIFNAAIDADTTKSVEVELDAKWFPEIGKYTFEITETAGITAGVTYNNKSIYLVVTILRTDANTGVNDVNNAKYVAAVHYETEDGLKESQIVNEYRAGSLAVNKQITGNMANKDDTFEVTVTFKAPEGKKIESEIYYADGTTTVSKATVNEDKTFATAVITLGHDETVVFTNIPYGVTYTVVESEEKYPDYKASYAYSDSTYTVDGLNNGIDTKDTEKTDDDEMATYKAMDKSNASIDVNADLVTITNNKDTEVDTGISVDSIPYIAMLGVVAIGGTGLVISKKRRSED